MSGVPSGCLGGVTNSRLLPGRGSSILKLGSLPSIGVVFSDQVIVGFGLPLNEHPITISSSRFKVAIFGCTSPSVVPATTHCLGPGIIGRNKGSILGRAGKSDIGK